MRAADHGPDFYKTRGLRGWCGFIFNVFLILVGFFFLGPGTYVSIVYMLPGVLIPFLLLLTFSLLSRPPSCLWFKVISPALSAVSSPAQVMDFDLSPLSGGCFLA